jgi:hypothetical protein
MSMQGRVDGDQLFPQQIAIEATHSGEKSCGGAGFVVLLHTPGQVIEDQLASGVDQLQPLFLQPAVEQGQIAAIGIAGVVGKPSPATGRRGTGLSMDVRWQAWALKHTALKRRVKIRRTVETVASLS